MTISTELNRITYTGNGATTAFAFPYKFFEDSDLEVYVDDVLQVITTNYTVSGAGLDAGGTVTFVAAPASLAEIVIVRVLPFTQELDYVEGDPFPAESHEEALDRAAMRDIQLKEANERSLRLSPTDTSGADTELPDLTAGYYLAATTAGDGFEWVSGVPAATTVTETQTSGTSQTVFTLTTAVYAPGSNNLTVFVDGVYQNSSQYVETSSTVVTFGTAVPDGIPVTFIVNVRDVATGVTLGTNVTYQYNNDADTRTVTARLQDSVSVLDFGADPTGVASSSAAFTAAFAAAESVYVPAGTYSITSRLSITTARNIYGDGYASKLIPTAAMDGTDGFETVLYANALTGVTIKNLHIDLQLIGVGNTWQGNGIRLQDCTECEVSGIHIYNSTRNGILFEGTTKSIIEKCNIYNSTVDPAETTSDWGNGIALLDASSGNRVVNNRVKNQAIGINVQQVVPTESIYDVAVTGNEVEDCYVYGISFYRVTTSDDIDRATISNNVINGVRGSITNVSTGVKDFGAGIYQQGCVNISVVGNSINNTNQQTAGSTLTPASIGSTNTNGGTIVGNSITGSVRDGIFLSNSNNLEDLDLGTVISGNNIIDVTGSGINVIQRNNIAISGNYIKGTGAHGVIINNTTLHFNYAITGNMINDVTSNGITLTNADFATVCGNVIDTSAINGINISTSDNLVISNNIIRNITTRAIQVGGADHVVTGNVIDNSSVGILTTSTYGKHFDNVITSTTTRLQGASSNFTTDDGTATPSTLGRTHIDISTGTNITYFTGAQPGDELFLHAIGSRTIVHGIGGSNIRLSGSANFAMVSGDSLHLVRDDADRWDEMGRHVL